MIPFFDLNRQYQSLKSEIDAAVSRVLSSGRFILGEEVRSFEREFADYIGTRFAAGVGSGTEALHIALVACGVQAGDEVITVSHTAVATVAAIDLAGAKPVFVDIDPETYSMDPEMLSSAITSRTKAVVPVHLYGRAADMSRIIKIVKQYGIYVIEDCAQAHGAYHGSNKVGSIGDIGCFSFYPTKNLGCYGDGGMVVTNDPTLYEGINILRQYGWRDRYVSAIRGFNSRLDEIQAAALKVKLPYLDSWITRRRELAVTYDQLLAGSDILRRKKGRNSPEHVHHLYVIECDRRDLLQSHLLSKGIQTIVHYPVPVHLQPAYADLGYIEGTLPETERLAKQVLSLPLYPELTNEEIEEVAQAIKAYRS